MLSLSNSRSAQALPTRYSWLHDTTRGACYRGLRGQRLTQYLTARQPEARGPRITAGASSRLSAVSAADAGCLFYAEDIRDVPAQDLPLVVFSEALVLDIAGAIREVFPFRMREVCTYEVVIAAVGRYHLLYRL